MGSCGQTAFATRFPAGSRTVQALSIVQVVSVGLIFDSLSTTERVRKLTDAYREAGGTGSCVMVRRVWVGPTPQELLEQQLSLLGQDQAASMPVKQRHAEAFLERADLSADGGLAEVQRFAGMGEAARLGDGVKHS